MTALTLHHAGLTNPFPLPLAPPTHTLMLLTRKVHGALLAPPGRHHLEPGVLVLLLPVSAWALSLVCGTGALGAAAACGADATRNRG